MEHSERIEPIEHALEEARQTFSERNSASRRAHLSACEHLPGGNTRTVLHATPFPMTFASGERHTLISLDGHTYIDFLGEFTAGIYGHSNEAIRLAVQDALKEGWSLGGNNVYEKELAKLVCERFQPTVEKVRFTNSGTEANTMAVATAIAWTGRKKILVFKGGYHGSTLSFRIPLPGATQQSVNLPHEWVAGEYNDVKRTEDLLASLPSDSLAAILVEPMLGSGGAILGSLPFLRFLRSYASTHGAILIFDEVMASRLSYRGLGYKLGIQPDMMTMGKWLGGGMSFGAFGGRTDIMALYDPTKSGSLVHAGTFNNNVISMAAGCAGCKVLDEQTIDRLNSLGEVLKAKVQLAIDTSLNFKQSKDVGDGSVANGHSGPVEYKGNITDSKKDHANANLDVQNDRAISSSSPMYVTGIGSILVVHLPSPKLQSLFYHHMLSEGIYLAERGFIALNIELGLAEVDQFVAATKGFVVKYNNLIIGA